MKPYFLALYNRMRFWNKKHKCKNLASANIELFSKSSKFVFSKTSEIEFDEKIISDGRFVVIVDQNAKLRIGNSVYFNEGVMISCKSSINIGNGCQFGPDVKIFDNNHKYNAQCGVCAEHSSAPIIIGDNCWIGANTIILKGTTIGKNTVVGAGCVVSGIIPDCSVVTQNRSLHIEPMRK